MQMGQRRLWADLLWGAASALVLAGCNNPLIILDVAYANRGEQFLQLQAQLASGVTQNPAIAGMPARLALSLPADASGPVQLNLFGQNMNGCQVSQATLKLELPGGLSQASETPVQLAPPTGLATSFPCTTDRFCQCLPAAQPGGLQAVLGFTGIDAIAVGQKGMIEQCSGAACRPLTFPSSQDLLAVWGSTQGHFYAVGNLSPVIRCDAGPNSTSCAALTSNTPRALNAVAGSDADHVYAVGEQGAIIRCSSTEGSCTPLNSGLSTQALYTVWASDASNVYAAGGGGAVVRCSSGSMSCQSLMPPWATADLHGSWGSSAAVYIVGDSGSMGFCASGAPSCFKIDAKAASFNLKAVSGSGTSLYVVGDTGIMSSCNITNPTFVTCTAMNTGTKANLHSVWASPDGTVYAVGDGGTLVSCNSAGCTPQVISTGQTLRSVWGSDASHVYAVGDGGVVLFKGQ
jgi:hypothetical protein